MGISGNQCVAGCAIAMGDRCPHYVVKMALLANVRQFGELPDIPSL
jgi:hypothetical protein